MDRRKFIKTANAGIITTSVTLGFSNLLLAQSGDEKPIVYYYKPLASTKSDGLGYQLKIYSSAVKDLKNARGLARSIEVRVSEVSKSNILNSKSNFTLYIFDIKKSKPIKGEEGMYLLSCKLLNKGDGEDLLPKEIAKKMKIKMYISKTKPSYNGATILDKKGEKLVRCEPNKSGSSGNETDCFITTACVRSRGLADDCKELQTLRNFRDTHMNESEEGRALADMYYQLAPEIVEKIDAQANSAELYDYIYAQMILPAVELVEQGELKKAQQFYTECTLGLKDSLN